MGLKGYGDNEHGPAFVEDVLRIKVVGRTGLHLSIVDLPGLISTASEEQTEQDVETVQRMVDSYIEKPRTIILAIVQASNDIANQSIIRKSKKYDKGGSRTVGVITKPDLIIRGTEGRIALLAKNEDTTKLELGFYMLKNPNFMEMQQGVTSEQRSANELRFFGSSPWKEQRLDPNRVGIDKLREYLQRLLDRHIEHELPKVRKEIQTMMKTTQRQLAALPMERPTTAHLRIYLSDLALQFYSMCSAAINGDYDAKYASFFATEEGTIGETRLRAVVHKANMTFAHYMRENGKAMRQVDGKAGSSAGEESEDDDANTDEDESGDSTSDSDSGVKDVTEREMRGWVKQVCLRAHL